MASDIEGTLEFRKIKPYDLKNKALKFPVQNYLGCDLDIENESQFSQNHPF